MKWWALPILWIISWSAWAVTLNLAWTKSTSAEVTGYYLYAGQTRGVYTRTYNIGDGDCVASACSYTLINFPSGTWYLSLKGHDANGNRSGFSNERTVP